MIALMFAVALAAPDPLLVEQDLRVQDSPMLKSAQGPQRLKALRAMGRIQSPAYAQTLLAAISDKDPKVQEEAAFSLGQLAMAQEASVPEAWQQALKTAPARCAATEALGKAGGAGVEELLVSRLQDDDPCLRSEAALGLFRLRYLKRIVEYSTPTVQALCAALQDPLADVRWRSAYAFSRWPEPRAKAALSAASQDPDVWTRMFSVRALAQLKAVPSKASRDPDARVRREAAAGGAVDEAAFKDESPHVRAAAWSAAGAERASLLESEASPLARGEALRTAASPALLAKERASGNWWLRVKAYEATTSVPDLLAGVEDADPRVAAAALEALAKSTDSSVVPVLDKVLRDPASAMELRGTAADAAAERKDPVLRESLLAALRNSQGREWAEFRDSVRKALPELPAEAPPQASASPFLGELPEAPVSVLLKTEKGDIGIELAVQDAPIHSAAFLKGVRSGFYDGLVWHRVVSNFVIQGGDPRGSGWGDSGFFLRDEVNRLRFERGAVGMPKAGKDTGGCQLFITHVPTPHLDGRYTVFGRVTQGMEVVDRIEPGDKILSATVSSR